MKTTPIKIVNSKGKTVRYDFVDSNLVKEMTKNADSRIKVCTENEAQGWINENSKVKEVKREKENDYKGKISKQ